MPPRLLLPRLLAPLRSHAARRITTSSPHHPQSARSSSGDDATSTETSWSPPEGLQQRMWASGSFYFQHNNQMCVGEEVECQVNVEKVDVKEGKMGKLVFVTRRLIYRNIRGLTTKERRTHVYRAPRTKRGDSILLAPPPSPSTPTSVTEEEPYDFGWNYLPTRATLFRYSAATFNAHRIHLDPDYCRREEGHADCLVHGPLTATLLMTLVSSAASASHRRLKRFEYRATSPLLVDRIVRLRGRWMDEGNDDAKMWSLDDQGTVGMTATAEVVDS